MSNKLIVLGSDVSGRTVGTLTKSLTTHTTIVGMTGSGKTGVVLGIVEELVRNQIPVVILDIKGDMSNIFLQSDPLLMSQIHPRVLTPGASHGESVNVTSGLSSPNRTSEAVTSLLNLIDVNSDPIKSRQHAYISAILSNRHKKNQPCRLLDLVIAVQEPPFKHIGAMPLDEVMGKAARKTLAAHLNNVLVAPSFAHWREGVALDLKALITSPSVTKTPVVVYTIAHLTNEDERNFAISLLFEEAVAHMRSMGGSDELKLAFVVDECFGLMPPKGNSATKTALLTLLKQGRAMGLGVILATQNPMDLDYKGMANCATWIIGRLQTDNDRRRLVEGVCNAVPGLERKQLTEQVGALSPRQFLLAKGNTLAPYYTRETTCNLKGPMDSHEISAIVGSNRAVKQAEESVLSRMRRVFS